MKTIQSKSIHLSKKDLENLTFSKTILMPQIAKNHPKTIKTYPQALKISGPAGVQTMIIPSWLHVNINTSLSTKDHITITPLKVENTGDKVGILISQLEKMIMGVTSIDCFKKQIKLIGIGYKITYVEAPNLNEKASIILNIGFSHSIQLPIPSSIKVSTLAIKENKNDPSFLELSSSSLVDLNNFVYQIQSIRPAKKSFKGTGITILTP